MDIGVEDDIQDDKTSTGIRGNKKLKMFLYGFTYFMSGVAYALPAPFYPQVAEGKGISKTLIGFVFSIFELTVFITSPLFGSYLTTIGPKFAFNSGITVAGTCTILFGLLDRSPPGVTFVVLSFLIRSVGAIGFSSLLTSIMAASSVEYPKNIATTMSFLEGAFGIGMMIGPGFGGVLYAWGGFGLPFFFVGGLVLVEGMFTYFLMPAPRQTPPKRKSQSSLTAIRSSLVQIGILSTVFGSTGAGFLESTLALHLKPFGLSVIWISLFFIIVPCAYTVTSPILGYLSDTKGVYKELIVIGQFLYGIGYLILGPSNLLPFIPYTLGTVILGLTVVGMTFGCTILPPFKCILTGAINVGFEENIETYALVSGMANSIYSLGAFLGPMIGGVLVEKVGDQIAFTIVGFFNIVISVIALIGFNAYRLRTTENHLTEERIGLVSQENILSDE